MASAGDSECGAFWHRGVAAVVAPGGRFAQPDVGSGADHCVGHRGERCDSEGRCDPCAVEGGCGDRRGDRGSREAALPGDRAHERDDGFGDDADLVCRRRRRGVASAVGAFGDRGDCGGDAGVDVVGSGGDAGLCGKQ